MTVSIIGSGRVGLCLGVLIAKAGHSVLLTDKDPSKKEILEGKFFFYEPQLESCFHSSKNCLKWTRQVDLILSSQYIFFCLSFPSDKKGNSDLTELLEWVKLLSEDKTAPQQNKISLKNKANTKNTEKSKTLVIKSTCPIGAYQKIKELVEGRNISVIVCPEFLREGQALQDLSEPERIVIGSKNKEAGRELEKFYKTFCKPKKIIHSDPQTAELSKLACNSFLGAKISFINEWAGLLESIGGNIKKLQEILGSDSRIGDSFLTPGLGYGGYCLPKDIRLAALSARSRKYKMRILEKIQEYNEELPQLFFQKIKQYYKKLNKVSLAFWGISFKKNTDNLRNSPALKLIYFLLKDGAELHIYDPLFTKENVMRLFKKQKDRDFKNKELDYLVKKIPQGKVFFYKSAEETLSEREGLIVAGDSDEFKKVSLNEIKSKLTQPFLADGRSFYSGSELKKKGFFYYQRGEFNF